MKKFRALGGLLIVGASMICMAASGGCGTNLHKAEISAGAIAASLHTAAVTNHTNTLETDDERKAIAGYIYQAAAANGDFIGVLKSAEAKGGTPDTASIVIAFQGLTARIDQLNQQGVLHLKSPKAQADFDLIISSIRAELAVIQGLYPTTTAKAVPWGGGGVLSAGLTLTAAEIEELIALVIAAGSALAPKLIALRGQTGVEILTEAEADDAAAEEIATEDGGAPAPAPAAGSDPPQA